MAASTRRATHGVAAGEGDAEAAVVGAGHVDGAPGEHLDAVAAHLLAADGGELRRGQTLVAEEAVHVGGGGVARLAGVDDDDRAALATQLQGGGETGRRAADHGHVAVPFDGVGGVCVHLPNDTIA